MTLFCIECDRRVELSLMIPQNNILPETFTGLHWEEAGSGGGGLLIFSPKTSPLKQTSFVSFIRTLGPS